MRLLTLYLRSRLTGWAVLSLAASGPIAWLWLKQFAEDGSGLRMSLIVIPLMPAVVIGASTRSPFGDIERTASHALLTLRFGHLAGLLICGAVTLGLASVSTTAGIEWELTRNLLGYCGLALLAVKLTGPGIAWMAPLGYGTAALLLAPASRWAWPARSPIDGWSVTVAVALAMLGLLLVTLRGSPDRADELA